MNKAYLAVSNNAGILAQPVNITAIVIVTIKKEEDKLMKQNFICQALLKNKKKALTPVIRKTEQGVTDYANRMFNKYGDEVIVEVGHFDDQLNWVTDCTYA